MPSCAERHALTGCTQASQSLNVCAGAEKRQQANHGSNSSCQGAPASHGAKTERHAKPPSQALQDERRGGQQGVRVPVKGACDKSACLKQIQQINTLM